MSRASNVLERISAPDPVPERLYNELKELVGKFFRYFKIKDIKNIPTEVENDLKTVSLPFYKELTRLLLGSSWDQKQLESALREGFLARGTEPSKEITNVITRLNSTYKRLT